MKKVLIADTLPDVCVDMLKDAGLEVQYSPGLSPEELKEAASDASGIICRSGAKITADILETADNLEAVCRAGVGVNNIDVRAASRKGVVVMNTPGGNTVSTAEHAFALMMALARNIGPAYIGMRESKWEKKKCVGSQLCGATLGVVGLGRIGQTVARRAVSFGMNVLALDPYVSREMAEKMGVELFDNLDDMLPRVDYLTLHVPQNAQTEGLISAEKVSMMKNSACIINCARGAVVDQDAVVAAVSEGRLGGAAFDVFVKEPPEDFAFAQHDRILATPHLGASTEEAQMAVATEAAEQIIDALNNQHFRSALNISAVPPEEMKALQPYCKLAEMLGGIVAQINDGRPQSVQVTCKGEMAGSDITPVLTHGAMGVMRYMLGEEVNVVSAPHLAEERGIEITSSTTVGGSEGYTDLITVTLVTDKDSMEVSGTVFGREHLRLVRVAGFEMDIVPDGYLLFVFGKDEPGLIGRVGGVIGGAGVNIGRMAFGREQAGGRALLALKLDAACDDELKAKIAALDSVESVLPIEL